MTILEQLYSLKDESYAEFQSKLTPGIPREQFIGVRVPNLRKLAKSIVKDEATERFLQTLPHQYYDENLLHGLLLAEVKDYSECLRMVNQFLPYVDNWAVCDTMSPKIFARNKHSLLGEIRRWTASTYTYTCRFGIEMLMSHFLDADFKPEYLEIPASVKSDEYYVNMMIAWFFATALAKQWDSTIVYLQENRLPQWVHNKTVQKACESYRITPEQKQYLKTLKR